jgi:menaquinone-dependent protoporphyrinogen oxidase
MLCAEHSGGHASGADEEVAIMTFADEAEPDRARGVRVLVSAASMHGSTSDIAQVIAQVLSEQGLTVTVLEPEEVQSIEEYDAAIIGSAVYTGHWLDPAKDLVNRYHDQLSTRPVWLFSSGPVGNPVSKMAQGMAKDPVEMAGLRIASHARDHRIFAGKLDRGGLSHAQRASLLIFHGLEGDFRDWAEIRQWASGIAEQLTRAPA